MIVTSKRCYLNILTQLCDLNTLLNANYYMADIRTPDGSVHLADSLRYDENGQLTIDNHIQSGFAPSLGRYNIKYGSGELDPTPFVANVLVGIGEGYTDPIDRFLQHLNSSDTLISTYSFLFEHQLRGNGLQILIFSDDSIIEDYVHIVCGYLAQNFGCDITFIDPQYRPNVKGQAEYKGDKVFATKNIKDIRDAKLLMDFNAALSQSSGEAMNNLTVFLNSFDANQIMYLYNLLFPDAPLPPGNYSTHHVKQIIIGRVASQIPKNPLSNMFFTEDFMKILEEYESEDIDDSGEIIY